MPQYIDDVTVANVTFDDHLRDLRKLFSSLTRSLPRAILIFHHPGGQHFWQCYLRL